MAYQLIIDPAAIADIQDAIDYYDEQQAGLGKRFERALDKHFQVLRLNPSFQVRYDHVRCVPMKKYPFMIHYTFEEKAKLVFIRAVFHTALDPYKWTQRK